MCTNFYCSSDDPRLHTYSYTFTFTSTHTHTHAHVRKCIRKSRHAYILTRRGKYSLHRRGQTSTQAATTDTAQLQPSSPSRLTPSAGHGRCQQSSHRLALPFASHQAFQWAAIFAVSDLTETYFPHGLLAVASSLCPLYILMRILPTQLASVRACPKAKLASGLHAHLPCPFISF